MLVWQAVTLAHRFEVMPAQRALRALAALAPLALASCSGSGGAALFDTGSTDTSATDSSATDTSASAAAANESSAASTPPAAGAASAPATTDTSDTSSSAATAPAAADLRRATYHVPVPVELEPYADFDLTDLRFSEHGGEWELEYTLPVLLVGGDQKLSFRGVADANGEYPLRGDAGQVSCRSAGAGLRCDEVLSAIELDAQKLERALSAFSADESAARRAVAQRFSDDPIGVLTFPR